MEAEFEMIRSPAFGAGAASSFVIVRVAAVGALSVAPVAPVMSDPPSHRSRRELRRRGDAEGL